MDTEQSSLSITDPNFIIDGLIRRYVSPQCQQYGVTSQYISRNMNMVCTLLFSIVRDQSGYGYIQ